MGDIMDIKKILLFTVILMIAISSLSAVSAGWFDFGDDSKNDNKTVNATTKDTFIFYSKPVSSQNSSIWAAVLINGTPYYIDNGDDAFDKLDNNSASFKDAWIQSFASQSSSDLKVPVDKEFTFKCMPAKIGTNDSAYLITDVNF